MGPTNSDRQKMQLLIEAAVGCAGSEDLHKHKAEFLNFGVTYSNLAMVEATLQDDAVALYEKASQSLMQGVEDLVHGFEAWAIVKLYYSTYYYLRCHLAINGVSILRCPDICTLNMRIGERPTLWNRRNRSNDHKSTVDIFIKKFGSNDLLSTQSIDGVNPYLWLASMREWVNYRAKNFPDPYDKSYFFSTSAWTISDQIEFFASDDVPIYCFDADYACLALPLKRAQITAQALSGAGLTITPKFRKFFKEKLNKSKHSLHLQFLLGS